MDWMTAALVVSVVLNLALLYGSWNQYEKQLIFEMWYQDIAERAERGHERLRMLDELGSFESDDEVGMFFDILKDTYTEYYERTTAETTDATDDA